MAGVHAQHLAAPAPPQGRWLVTGGEHSGRPMDSLRGGVMLRLNYVEAGGKDPRPQAFTTSSTTEESVVTLRRDGR